MDTLKIDSYGHVRLLTLDRPEKLNAFDKQLYALCADAIEAAIEDPGVHVIGLTGRGRAFSAGVDLAELQASADGRATPGFNEAAGRFVQLLNTCPKPVVAAVNGLAVGIGTTLLTYVDLVFAGASARFQTPFSKLGVAPELGSSWRLPQVVGWQNAAWMLLSSEWISAQRAVETGLAFRVVPDALLLEKTLAAAQSIAAHRCDSLMAIKRTLQSWRTEASRSAEATEGGEFRTLLARGFESPLR